MSELAPPGVPIYLDYAATTPVDACVAARMSECLTAEGCFGNPGSSSHAYGEAASERIARARREVALTVGAAPEEVIFTSGATEADNLALFGIAQYYHSTGRHIVTARTEHKAVLDAARELERRGWSLTYLTPDRGGRIAPDQVAAALRPDTVLVSLMHVNNEIGVIQDIGAIAAACAAAAPQAFVHVDAAQSVGKCAVDLHAWGIDLLSLAAHKAYGPKGIGALIVSRRRSVQLTPLLYGGGQEHHLRSGTLATHQIVGMGEAFALVRSTLSEELTRVARLKARLVQGLEAIGGVLINGDPAHSVPHILSVSIEGVEGESLLAAVRSTIAVSTGSACSSAGAEPSYVLRALGRSDRLAEASLRFSLGRYTQPADIERAVEVVRAAVERLRRIAGS
ncbi:MAG TPA: aminotransferase class V-fold PLP-dependent enzyme [Steroidobacteraceae bacterium]|nr:aminotransferase class V-fold PLP-dependent enzyme [Steroidobacteraceae bacterium]